MPHSLDSVVPQACRREDLGVLITHESYSRMRRCPICRHLIDTKYNGKVPMEVEFHYESRDHQRNRDILEAVDRMIAGGA